MPNFFSDNPDIQFHFKNIDTADIVALIEDEYAQSKLYNYAPINYEDAIENYRKVLEVTGDIAGNYVAPRSASVDAEGATFSNGKVTYAQGTQKNVRELSQTDLMGFILPRQYGGLNIPFVYYMMAVEVMARADASLMNIF